MSQADTTSKLILSNVQVLTAGTRMEQDQEKGKPVQVTVVTLLVNPEQAERLALASTEGKIQLALRNPMDQGAPETPGIKTAALVGVARAAAPRDGRLVFPAALGEVRGAGDPGDAGARAGADGGSDPRGQARPGSDQVGFRSVATGHWQSAVFNQGTTTMTSAYTTEQRRLRRATNARPATTAALVVAIIVILVAAPRAQQPAPTFAASAAGAGGAVRHDGCADRRRPAGRPFDGAEHRLDDRARLADGAGHCRRDGDRRRRSC